MWKVSVSKKASVVEDLGVSRSVHCGQFHNWCLTEYILSLARNLIDAFCTNSTAQRIESKEDYTLRRELFETPAVDARDTAALLSLFMYKIRKIRCALDPLVLFFMPNSRIRAILREVFSTPTFRARTLNGVNCTQSEWSLICFTEIEKGR